MKKKIRQRNMKMRPNISKKWEPRILKMYLYINCIIMVLYINI